MYADELGRSSATYPRSARDVFFGTGEDLGRLLALSDGVFAFALTLLALTLTVPAFDTTTHSPGRVSGMLFGALTRGAQATAFVGYVFAFVMTGIWWMAHHRTLRYVERYDRTLVWLNLLLLLEIAVMPFVVEIYTRYQAAQTAVVVFAASQVVAGLVVNVMWTYATLGHRLVSPELDERLIRATRSWGWLAPVLFVASIGVSFFDVNAAQYTWAGVFVIQPIGRRYLMGGAPLGSGSPRSG